MMIFSSHENKTSKWYEIIYWLEFLLFLRNMDISKYDKRKIVNISSSWKMKLLQFKKMVFRNMCKTYDVWDYHYYWERKGGQHYICICMGLTARKNGDIFWVSKEKKAQFTITCEKYKLFSMKFWAINKFS